MSRFNTCLRKDTPMPIDICKNKLIFNLNFLQKSRIFLSFLWDFSPSDEEKGIMDSPDCRPLDQLWMNTKVHLLTTVCNSDKRIV